MRSIKLPRVEIREGLVRPKIEKAAPKDPPAAIAKNTYIKHEGKPAVRNGDKMVSNLKNTAPQPLIQPPAGVAPAGTADTPAELEKEQYSLRWQAISVETGEPIKDIAYTVIRKSNGDNK